jgi:putative phosphoribosyl transferase
MGLRTFRDRQDAGRRLGQRLGRFAGPDTVVVGLPRGGVPVAAEVARALRAPLDVLLVRKIGAPGNPELGVGAVAEDGTHVLNAATLRALDVTAGELSDAVGRAEAELTARARGLREDRRPVDLAGRTVILADDGLATGGTARAAARAIRARHPARIVLAVPVGAPDSLAALEAEVDDVVCLLVPRQLWSIGSWYDDFAQVTDAEVRALLAGRDLELPPVPRGVVVFAHGSGSSRYSPRNRQVARALRGAGFATLLFDLLTADEALDRRAVFDVELLAGRLADAVAWARAQPAVAGLRVGLFGASTGAAAALWAAAGLGDDVGAVVSRGGRPDLAAPRLPAVRAPTLLVVGARDQQVLELNRTALGQLGGPAELRVVAGATHLFEEPGTLEAVQRLAAAWFSRFLQGPESAGGARTRPAARRPGGPPTPGPRPSGSRAPGR